MPTVPQGLDLATFLLRLAGGGIMAYHGWLKLDNGVDGFSSFLESLDIPFPDFMAWVVVLLELVGGILIVVGLLTRVWSLLLALEMVYTTLRVKLFTDGAPGLIAPQGAGTGAEVDLLFLAVFLALVLIGPGRWSIDHASGLDAVAWEPVERRWRVPA